MRAGEHAARPYHADGAVKAPAPLAAGGARRSPIAISVGGRDVDEPERYRQGVHWRPRGEAYPERAHFVIVSSIAGPTVLAHELGHYFGNGHSDVPGNIMCYERGDVPPFFDETQGARIRFSLRRFLRDAELVRAEDADSGQERDVDQAADR